MFVLGPCNIIQAHSKNGVRKLEVEVATPYPHRVFLSVTAAPSYSADEINALLDPFALGTGFWIVADKNCDGDLTCDVHSIYAIEKDARNALLAAIERQTLTDEQVVALLRAEAPIAYARASFSHHSARIEQAGAQASPASPIEVRRLEIKAVQAIGAQLGVAVCLKSAKSRR